MTAVRPLLRWWLTALALVVAAGWLSLDNNQTAPTPLAPAPLTWATLPPQGQAVGALIARGGPFAHSKDGTVFGNRERLLPAAKRGYYREYTVDTPGLNHRGARRIVCGGWQAKAPDACYYSDDHYDSFRPIEGTLPQRSP